MSGEVPAGWFTSTLRDVADVFRGVGWAREQESRQPVEGANPVVRIANVQTDGFHLDDMLYVKDLPQEEKSARRISERTIVMVGSNGNPDRVGNAFLATPDVVGHHIASFLIGIEPQHSVSERFLVSWLRSRRVQDAITAATSGSTGLKNLSLTWLRDLQLRLPPIEEQQRIATVLYAIDEAIARTEDVIAATEELRKALLHELLTRGVPGWHTEWKDVPGIGTIPACWEVVRLGEVLREPIRNGFSATSVQSPTGWWVLSLGAVTPTGFDGRQAKPIDPHDARSGSQLEPGDLLVSRSNTRQRVGLAGIYRGDPPRCIYPDLLMRVRPDQSVVATEFLEALLLSPFGRAYFTHQARGTSGSMVKIDRSLLMQLRLPLPPRDEQCHISKILDAIAEVGRTEQIEREEMIRLKHQASALLLTGQLYPPEHPVQRRAAGGG